MDETCQLDVTRWLRRREASGLRGVLIRDCFGIDVEAVWDTLTKNIPTFKENVEDVVSAELAEQQKSND